MARILLIQKEKSSIE
ncbi:hypothetical protein PMI31_05832 [Pseudomonas sp. GM55]|nr:hypothetical protein PMI31_05832 [Pseudomonas sp. GM55]